MSPERRIPSHEPSAHHRLLTSHDDDPLASVANLFDIAMVFAVALLFALVSSFHLNDPRSDQNDSSIENNSLQNRMEIIQRKAKELDKYRISTQTLGGEGERLGTAYRLKNGEVIYVPENRNEQK